MLRNYFVINIILVAILGLLGFKFYGIATYSMDVPDAASVEVGKKLAGIDVKLKNRVPDKASFNAISKKDLFRPSRSASPVVGKTMPKTGLDRYPKLFATIIQGSNSLAIMQDPATKKTKSYRINDVIVGFNISEILEDRVVLTRGDEKVEIKLRDDKGVKSPRTNTLIRKTIRTNNTSRPAPIRRRPPVSAQNNTK